ncbi:hypothetical protein BS78_K219200 [Paspalum vaginatum]|uniref:DUF4220 domain-containing protein n=1 Tax=Paspalum vaginatum TaxID=158149 RepID=A0A9W7XAB7_9POAL|nr:hypothetical protein BS78_K219200 [Paspalum vaginatum]
MATMAPPPQPPPLDYIPCHSGLVSEEALRIIVEAKACFVALALALAYFLTASQHRLWSSSHLVKGFLFAATQPVSRFLLGMFTMLLAMPFRNDLYLLWGILLLAGYEGVYTISGYGVASRRSDLAVHEFARAYNVVILGLYVRYYSRASQFRYPLWALMVARFLERIVRFKIANARYGDASTGFVADYMKHEHKIHEKKKSTDDGEGDFSLQGCNYLIVGDSKSREARDRESYEPKYEPAEDTVTVAKVWGCDGTLLKSKKTPDDNELRDVCLSFALCKLLRRKFAGVATAERERPKAQRLVFDNLLPSGWERTFRVVRTELGFARDLLYTKYPILFCSGFPVVSAALFVVTVGVSVWITVSAVRHYHAPKGNKSNVVHGKNVDLLITFVILGMVTGMEICEFFIHLFSDWTKVMLVSEYVRKPWLRRPSFLNSVLKAICCGKIAEPIGSALGQFDLLKSTKEQRRLPECVVKLYHTARSFVLLTGDEGFRINKRKTLRPVPGAVMEMIWQTLQDNKDYLCTGVGQRKGTAAALEEVLSEYRKAPASIEAIMVCHVATSELEDKQSKGVGGSGDTEDARNGEGKKDLESGRSSDGCKCSVLNHRLVATTLSRYCAYLVFYKPRLLPVDGNSVRFMCNILVEEAKAAVGNKQGATNGAEEKASGGQEDGIIVPRGRKLARGLLEKARAQGVDDLWKALAELWCELIVSMAPHGNIGAHQKELGKGGEFITHLWALLYHAGIDDKFSVDDATPSREDNYSQGQGGAAVCSTGST